MKVEQRIKTSNGLSVLVDKDDIKKAIGYE